MAVYVKLGEEQYPASITGRLFDDEWNKRESKAITLKMSYEEAIEKFVNDIEWAIVQDTQALVDIVNEETGEVT